MGNSITFVSLENGQTLFDTESEKNTIGRTDQSDFVMPFSSISRDHGEIFLFGNRWILIDRGSTNGTFLNSLKLAANKPYLIDNGDQIVFGTFGTRVETTASNTIIPSLLLFSEDKYEGNFKIDEGTTFVYGGPKSTIRRPNQDGDPAFIVKQESGRLCIVRRSEVEQVILNSTPLLEDQELNDRDVIEIDGFTFLVSLESSAGTANQNSDSQEEDLNQPLPEYLKSRMGEDSWNDPYQEKLKNVGSKLSMEVPIPDDHQNEKPSKTMARSELGVQRFSRPSLETIRSEEIAKEKKYALYGIMTLVILLGMISILFNLYAKVVF